MTSKTQVGKFCCQDISLIENYDKAVADKEHQWDCHHRLEIQGQFRNSAKLLKRCRMYFNRPASELMFMTHDEHRRKLSEANRGKVGFWTGKRLSEDTKRKMSEAHRKYWETRRKRG